MNSFFSPLPLLQAAGLGMVRLLVGFFLIYHGWEIFDASKMNEYIGWDTFKNYTAGPLLVYSGKATELVGGALLFLGFLTRIAALLIIGAMLYIVFFIGHGQIWYGDQHPFLFVLLALVFFFSGPGKWSIDRLLFNKK